MLMVEVQVKRSTALLQGKSECEEGHGAVEAMSGGARTHPPSLEMRPSFAAKQRVEPTCRPCYRYRTGLSGIDVDRRWSDDTSWRPTDLSLSELTSHSSSLIFRSSCHWYQ